MSAIAVRRVLESGRVNGNAEESLLVSIAFLLADDTMIAADEAKQIAAGELNQLRQAGDSLLSQWPKGVVGEPVMVSDVFGRPSYWLVPFIVAGRVAGFVRILKEGRVAAVGTFCRRPGKLDTCPNIVTGISAEEARIRFDDSVQLEGDETAAPPVFVHDGPIGRETWMVVTVRGSQPHRWIFISKGGWYERRAGQTLEEQKGE
jgi:hypothetical protein